jgi:Glucose-6-phosphate dehydrogenase subunit.
VNFETAGREGRAVPAGRPQRHPVLARTPERRVALHRRDTAELVAEELRRLEPDEVYAETLRALAAGVGSPAP